MERLSHDLSLALEESNCGEQERRVIEPRRRTRSAGNLPTVTINLVEDGSSSSPPQAPVVTQPLSDSDDPHLNSNKANIAARHYCQIESDSFNENFSPTRPANIRRKRKFKKTPLEYADCPRSPPIEMLNISSELNPATVINGVNSSSLHAIKHKTLMTRSTFCGKRKFDMRERSYTAPSAKPSFLFKSDFKTKKQELRLQKKKDSVLQPGKMILKSHNIENQKTSLPGSSSFNFIYKNTAKSDTPILTKPTGYKISTNLPPFFDNITKNSSENKCIRKAKLINKSHLNNALRDPLEFEESSSGMDCVGNESSSLSSSDSDGVVTNESDREGDDELTDWPGIEDLKVFNKSLTFKSSKSLNNNYTKSISNVPPPKKSRKDKPFKTGWVICKNRFKKKKFKLDSENEEDQMSDSKTIIDIEEVSNSRDNEDLPHSEAFTSIDVFKNANSDNYIISSMNDIPESCIQTAQTNFSLQKTSSSDYNASEKSPQSDHCYSEHSMGNSVVTEVREIRAGCRRIRDERPGLLILSAANELLSKFLQDSCQLELKLPYFHDPEERAKLESLAKLYSLEIKVEMGRTILKKTHNTMQAIRVEHSYNIPSDHKRRCYGEDLELNLDVNTGCLSSQNDLQGITNLDKVISDSYSDILVDKLLLHPGELD